MEDPGAKGGYGRLVAIAGCRRHDQLAVDEFVTATIVGQRPDLVPRPVLRGICIRLGSASEVGKGAGLLARLTVAPRRAGIAFGDSRSGEIRALATVGRCMPRPYLRASLAPISRVRFNRTGVSARRTPVEPSSFDDFFIILVVSQDQDTIRRRVQNIHFGRG